MTWRWNEPAVISGHSLMDRRENLIEIQRRGSRLTPAWPPQTLQVGVLPPQAHRGSNDSLTVVFPTTLSEVALWKLRGHWLYCSVVWFSAGIKMWSVTQKLEEMESFSLQCCYFPITHCWNWELTSTDQHAWMYPVNSTSNCRFWFMYKLLKDFLFNRVIIELLM